MFLILIIFFFHNFNYLKKSWLCRIKKSISVSESEICDVIFDLLCIPAGQPSCGVRPRIYYFLQTKVVEKEEEGSELEEERNELEEEEEERKEE